MDVKAKIEAFNALKNKATKRAYLEKINENITSFKNRIKVSGSVAVITANYRAYLERVAATSGETHTNVAASSSTPRQRTRRAAANPPTLQDGEDDDENDDEYQDNGDDEDQEPMVMEDKSKSKGKKKRASSSGTRSKSKAKGKERAIDPDEDDSDHDGDDDDDVPATGLLSQLVIAPGVQASRVTRKCLQLMGSQFSTVEVPQEDDHSDVLEPLHAAISDLVTSHHTILLSADYAENFEKLRLEAAKVAPVQAPHFLDSLITAMGFKRIDDELGDIDDPMAAIPEGLDKELDILKNEFDLWLGRWSLSFPAPAPEDMSYPLDFTDSEKIQLRTYANNYILANLQLVARKNIKAEDVQEALKSLRKNWPITKGNTMSIAQLVFDEAKNKQFRRTESRSRSRSTAATASRRGSTVGVQPGEDEFDDNQAKRKRQEGVDSDPESGDASSRPPKSRRIAQGRGRGRGRGRTLHRQYSSPTRKGAETSLASIGEADEGDEDEEDEDEDELLLG